MTEIFIGLLLAIIWMAISGSFTLPNLVMGMAVGFIAMLLLRDRIGGQRLSRRLMRILALALLFICELFVSAYKVAVLVLTPNIRAHLKPGFIAYPLTAKSDREITLLANLITLTPGTLSVDVSEDRKTLYIHALEVEDRDALVRSIATGFERQVMEVFK
ncbi:Na+/H+ antiporter subunit E [Paradevosia shaoguanensis]|jgi:multicomponent Na+:H+ antiporter subunit E|uniref:Na+/H+ antiporter subunit E n=1 Tax=Paradevosia shaoguanensis TaxID=1335043 RepID=A0AA41QLV1_9HYPH|nr:Na+/H+ antiporter subunit E [Paradevosia shaoguanensis]MCF1741721.1 Na+/H+ antiporter subunit E [Paradevosia shaoguanensis]MCI0126204.1 Na+/H+ antiporter subunit E [Paradevosia shaoguanensis]QMV02939.1 Na+/H+ antiporter subunit E [Devosia sp. D6-9]CDP51704.1 Na(+) H(+) antiporter subunit E [Devosia sp. DBB001]